MRERERERERSGKRVNKIENGKRMSKIERLGRERMREGDIVRERGGKRGITQRVRRG